MPEGTLQERIDKANATQSNTLELHISELPAFLQLAYAETATNDNEPASSGNKENE